MAAYGLSIKQYNLPAKSSNKVAIALCAIYILIPNMVLAECFGISIIIYYCIKDYRLKIENEFGLGFQLIWKTKRLIVLLLFIYLIVTPLGMYGLNYQLEESRFNNNSQIKPEYDSLNQISYNILNIPEFLRPSTEIYAALEHRNTKIVINSSIKPIIGGVIIVPIVETTMIFGLLVPVVWRRYNYKTTLLVVPLIFGILHFDAINRPLSLLLPLLLGFLWTYYYMSTRSLYPAILIHSWVNFSLYILITIVNWGLPPSPLP